MLPQLTFFALSALLWSNAHAACADPYTVKDGDTCFQISQSCGVTLDTLLALNPSCGSSLSVGQTLRLTNTNCANPYIVVQGDTCSDIATKCGVDATAFIKANHACGVSLQVGDKLTFAPGSLDVHSASIHPATKTTTTTTTTPTPTPTSTTTNTATTATFTPTLTPNPQCPDPYPVLTGDSCSTIAPKCGLDVNFLMSLNPSLCGPGLKVGDKLKLSGIPASSAPVTQVPHPTVANPESNNKCKDLYVVIAGDTCADIAQLCNMDLQALVAKNPVCGTALKVNDTLHYSGIVPPSPGRGIVPPPNPTRCSDPYTVVDGDSCYLISTKCKVDFEGLMKLNPSCSDVLKIGDQVHLSAPPPPGDGPATGPSGTSCHDPYTVVEGDSCSSIAEKCGVNFVTLTSINENCGENLQPGASVRLNQQGGEMHFKDTNPQQLAGNVSDNQGLNIPIIVIAVVGVALTAAVVAIVVFIVRRRKYASVPVSPFSDKEELAGLASEDSDTDHLMKKAKGGKR